MKSLLLIFVASLFLCGCGNDKPKADDRFTQDALEILEYRQGKSEPAKLSQAEFIESCKKQGVSSYSFDKDNYLVYTVSRIEVSADPDWVAKQHFDLANVDNISGCRLVDENGKEFGRYEP